MEAMEKGTAAEANAFSCVSAKSKVTDWKMKGQSHTQAQAHNTIEQSRTKPLVL